MAWRAETDASFHQLDDAKARALPLLTCHLCTKQFEDPRVLPCHHTFCFRCLSAHVDHLLTSHAATSSTRLGAFSCPRCSADVGLPTAGVSAFPVDQSIRNIRDLVVEEMAKDLASRFKGRLHGDGVCNGGDVEAHGEDVHSRRGGLSTTTRLGRISERSGGDADDASGEYGTGRTQNESASRTGFTNHTPTTDDPVFERHTGTGSAFSNVRDFRRRSRNSPQKSYDDDAAKVTGEASPSDPDAAFSRSRLGYSTMPRRRRARMTDGESQFQFYSIGRCEGRTMTSSGAVGSQHTPPQTPEPSRTNIHRPYSNVDVSSKSSPFDNLNRDDDTSSEPYTPIIGRNRHHSSMPRRRQRPLFDPNRLFDKPTPDDEVSRSDRSSMFSNHESSWVGHDRDTGIRSQTRDTLEFSDRLRRTVSTDEHWPTHTSDHREQKLPENGHQYQNDTPENTRNRYESSSLPYRRRPHPVFDPNHLFNKPNEATTSADEQWHRSARSNTFSNHESTVGHTLDNSIRSQTHNTSEFSDRFRRTVSTDEHWATHTSDHREQTMQENRHQYQSDTSEISPNRYESSSLPYRRRPRPVFDPSHLFNKPSEATTLAKEQLSGSDRSNTFSNHESRVGHNLDTSIRPQTHNTSVSSESLQGTVSTNENWTQYTSDACEQQLSENRQQYQSDGDCAEMNRTDANISQHRTDNLDSSGLSVLLNLPASMKTAATNNKVFDFDTTSTSNDRQSQTHLGHTSDDVEHRINAADSLAILDEVSSVSQTQNDVASQLNGRCRVDVDTADDDVNSKHSEPVSVYSANSRGGKPDNMPPPSTSFYTADSTNEKAESSSARLDEADAGNIFAAKTRAVRKRPPVYIGTEFPLTAGGSTKDAATDIRTDGHNSKSVNSNKEPQYDQRFELQPPSVSHSTAADINNGSTSFDADVKGGIQSINLGQTAAHLDDAGPGSADASPTVETTQAAELQRSVESNDVQSSGDDVPFPQWKYDEDSAVYSAGIDSDVSLRSVTEACITSPTTDDDDDADITRALEHFDESLSGALGDQHDEDSDDVRCGLDDNDRAELTLTDSRAADAGTTDVERQDAAELIGEAPESGAIDGGDGKDDDSEGRSSVRSPADEPCQQNEQHQPQIDVDTINEDDVGSKNRTTTEKDGDVECGSGTSQQRGVEADGVTEEPAEERYLLATGLAVLGDGCLVVADYGGGRVWLCDADGRAEYAVDGLKPFSVATSSAVIASCDDEVIYVGDRRRKTLVALDSHGADVAQWPDNQFDWVCGIACLPDGQLAVLDRSRSRQLCIYATSGDDARPLAELGGQGSSIGDLCMAEFIAADSRGRVLVSDSGNHCVKAFDRRVARPGVVAVYGSTRGSGDAQLEWPKGVAVDAADNVFVADCRNGRVVCFSVDGRPLGSVVPAVRGPFAVSTLPASLSGGRRRLAVTTYSVSGVSDFQLYDYDTDEIFV